MLKRFHKYLHFQSINQNGDMHRSPNQTRCVLPCWLMTSFLCNMQKNIYKYESTLLFWMTLSLKKAVNATREMS